MPRTAALVFVLIRLVWAGSVTAAGTVPARGLSGWTYEFDNAIVWQMKTNDRLAPAGRRFTSLFPYAGSVWVAREGRRLAMSYDGKLTLAWHEAMPGLPMLAIVDGRQDRGEFNGWTAAEYAAAADLVAEKVLADPNAAGAQVDVEPFDDSQVPFYAALRLRLNAGGKLLTAFVSPGRKDAVLTSMYRSTDVLVLSGYDYCAATPAEYRDALTKDLGRCAKLAASSWGNFIVGIPAAASSCEFEIQAGAKCPRKDSGFKQTDWLGAALGAARGFERDPRCLGLALWLLTPPPAGPDPQPCKKCCTFPAFVTEPCWALLRGG